MKKFLIMLAACLALIAIMSYANSYLENRLPYVTHVEELESGKKLTKGIQQFHIHFSEPMDRKFSGFNQGPSSDAESLFVIKTGFESDRVAVITVDLESDKKYQLEASTSFRNTNGKRIKPYLIEFNTE